MQSTLLNTDQSNADFQRLIKAFDKYLSEKYPEKSNGYFANNIIEVNENVVVAYRNNTALGCGCFKKIDAFTAELKRMFVLPEGRGLGIAQEIIASLESRALAQGYQSMVLETLYRQNAAVTFYKKQGYEIIENYGPYVGLEHSICMQKTLKK